MLRGMTQAYLADLDLLTFNALFESVVRIEASQKIQDVYSMHVAAQGESKNVEEWVKKNWSKQAGEGSIRSADELRNAIKSGF